MQISGSGQAASASLQISYGRATDRIKNKESEEILRSNLDYVYREVAIVRNALEQIRNPLKLKKIDSYIPAQTASATSMSSLGLVTGTATTLQSTEEINATPTSFSTFGPNWDDFGVSVTTTTVGGSYDGSNGSGTLTFTVENAGVHGTDLIKIKVDDPINNKIEDIIIIKSDPIDQVYTLSNGLSLSFGAGEFIKDDVFTIDVSAVDPPSYSPSNPSWTGTNTSDALVTLDSIYDGSNGTQTLTFEVTKGGVHGTDDLRMEVQDGNLNPIETIFIDSINPIDQQYTLSNGIIFSLGAGSLSDGDIFTLDVYDSVGSVVDLTNPMNGTRSDNPVIEYGYNVTDGSFDISGTTITVNATDTINDILNRITQSGADVTASFDAANEVIVLTRKTSGDETITLANDTSGFLAAMKLDGASEVLGSFYDADAVMSSVAQFSSVTSGDITINGINISIDVSADSLNDVIARINSSTAGVTAGFSPNSQIFTITSNNVSQTMVLDSGTTGFFPALNILDGTYNPTTAQNGFSDEKRVMPRTRAIRIAKAIDEFKSAFNAIFDRNKFQAEKDSTFEKFLEALRNDLKTAVLEGFGSTMTDVDSGYGIAFDFGTAANRVFDFGLLDKFNLVKKLTKEGNEVNELFFGLNRKDDDGLIEKILMSLETHEDFLKDIRGTTGVFVDVKA